MDLEDGKRMFGDLKSKLGFGSKSQEPEYDGYYDEAYDEYADDFDGYGDGFDDGYESYAPRSERENSYEASDPYRVTSRSRSTTPRLVSIEDVRANTRANSAYDRDFQSARQASPAPRSSSFDNGRITIDSSLPPQMTPEGTAAAAAAATRRRSEGLDSLFSPTTDAPEPAPAAAAPARTTYESYEAFSNYQAPSYSVARSLKVIKPVSYGDVEGIARSVRMGDVVVLAMGNTPEALTKRILDFSFGVASALEASVDAVGNKVFAITKGDELTDAERITLRNQGVL